jgi:hypothetical protein
MVGEEQVTIVHGRGGAGFHHPWQGRSRASSSMAGAEQGTVVHGGKMRGLDRKEERKEETMDEEVGEEEDRRRRGWRRECVVEGRREEDKGRWLFKF